MFQKFKFQVLGVDVFVHYFLLSRIDQAGQCTALMGRSAHGGAAGVQRAEKG